MGLTWAIGWSGAGAVALAGLGYGSLIPRGRNRWGAEVGWALGLGVFSSLLMGLGVAGVLRRPALLAVVGVGLVLLVRPEGRRRIRADRWPDRREGLSLLLFLPSLVLSMVPPTFYDAMTYHLTVVGHWLRTGTVGVIESNNYSFFPLDAELIYTGGVGIAGVPEAAVPLHVLMGVLATMGAARVGQRLVGSAANRFTPLIFASIPSVLMLTALPKNDLAVVMFMTVALGRVVEFLDGEELDGARALVLGLGIGYAVGAKYNALYMSGSLLLSATVAGIRRGLRPSLRALGIVLLFVVLAGGPWYLRSFLASGNPVYPTAESLFGTAPFQRAGFLIPVQRRELPLRNLLTFPFELSLGRSGYGSFGNIGPMFMILLPAALLVRARVRHVGVLVGFVVLSVLAWSRTVNQARFLLSLLVPLSAVASAALYEVGRRWKGVRWVLAAGLAFTVASNLASFYRMAERTMDPIPFLTGQEGREEYLDRAFHPHEVFRWANRELPADAKVLFVGETRGFYLERDFVAGSPNDLTIIVVYVQKSRDLPDLLRRLRKAGFTHVIYNPSEVARLEEYGNYLHFQSPREEQLYREFLLALRGDLLFQARGVALFRIPRAVQGERLR